jgi:hypothetical protein
MKWSNHSRLSTYGVTLVGWPSDVPEKNPSTLSVHHLKVLLEELEEGKIKFVKDERNHDPESSQVSWPIENVQETEVRLVGLPSVVF